MQPRVVRRAVFEELAAIRDAHEDSIRSLGTEFYNEEIMLEWGRNRPIEPYIESFQGGDIYFIAKESEADPLVLGFSSHSIKEGKHWLQRLFIRGDQRGNGLGRLLCQQVEKVAQEAGARELFVTGALSGRRFYDSSGFTLIEMTKSPVGRRDDLFVECMVMKKVLS